MACLAPFCPANFWRLLARQVRQLTFNFFIGAGKTTLLNFLSGREISNNLTKTGVILCNGVEKETITGFSSLSAYVQ
jgi:ABC-type transport system involved in cytochrome bd biosynthesis fused ATPase/permease subunit